MTVPAKPGLSAFSAALSPAPLIASLFFEDVTTAEFRGEANSDALYPDEARLCAGFGPKRVADFAAGRLCAHRVLTDLGYRDVALPIGADRRPAWPADVVGSISHTAGYCGVAAARAGDYESIGFDVETLGRIGEDLWPQLFTGSELERLRAAPRAGRDVAATVFFSAKEAFYKCQFALTQGWLDFTDVELEFEGTVASAGSFRARIVGRKTDPRVGTIAGRYAVEDVFVATGIAFRRART